jgi:hypothetical protein
VLLLFPVAANKLGQHQPNEVRQRKVKTAIVKVSTSGRRSYVSTFERSREASRLLGLAAIAVALHLAASSATIGQQTLVFTVNQTGGIFFDALTVMSFWQSRCPVSLIGTGLGGWPYGFSAANPSGWDGAGGWFVYSLWNRFR